MTSIYERDLDTAFYWWRDLASINMNNKISQELKSSIQETTVGWLTKCLKKLKFNVLSSSSEDSSSHVLAEKVASLDFPSSPQLPTILFYASYYVHPCETFPQLVRENGRYYGGGATDDRFKMIAILSGINAYAQRNFRSRLNIKVLFDTSSHNKETFIRQYAEKLHAHAIVVIGSVPKRMDANICIRKYRLGNSATDYLNNIFKESLAVNFSGEKLIEEAGHTVSEEFQKIFPDTHLLYFGAEDIGEGEIENQEGQDEGAFVKTMCSLATFIEKVEFQTGFNL